MSLLSGIRVAEWSTGFAGPYAGQLLAAFGAEVIKFEQPGGGDFARTWGPVVSGESLYFASVNRGKQSVAVDLRQPEGREVGLRLVEQCDVLIENFRPGTLAKWGLSPAQLLERNPRLIICQISGFGQEGPYRDLPAFDPVVQAISGLMSVTGEPDGQPLRVPVPISDILAGVHSALACVAALTEPAPRKGRVIDVNLLDTMLSVLFPYNLIHLGTESPIRRMGNRHPSLAPYETFPTADSPICVAVASERLWERFCHCLERLDLLEDERFRTNGDRLRNRPALCAELEATFRRRTALEWIAALGEAEVPSAPVNTVAEAFASPHVAARGLIQTVEHPKLGPVRLPGFPAAMAGLPPVASAPPPALGEHTDSVLTGLGYNLQEVAALRAQSVIA